VEELDLPRAIDRAAKDELVAEAGGCEARADAIKVRPMFGRQIAGRDES